MSEENVELVRRALWEGVDAASWVRDDDAWPEHRAEFEALFAPDCAFAWIAEGQRTEATGLDEAREVWLDFFEPWESVRAETERIIPLGDKVVTLGRQRARIAGTEQEVELIGAGVYLVRHGRVASAEFYANRAEGLDAAGLRE